MWLEVGMDPGAEGWTLDVAGVRGRDVPWM